MFVGNVPYMKNSCCKMPWLININRFEGKENHLLLQARSWQWCLESPKQAKLREARSLPFKAGMVPGKRLELGTALKRLCSSWQQTKVHFSFCSQVPWKNESLAKPGRCELQLHRPGGLCRDDPSAPFCTANLSSTIPKWDETLEYSAYWKYPPKLVKLHYFV